MSSWARFPPLAGSCPLSFCKKTCRKNCGLTRKSDVKSCKRLANGDALFELTGYDDPEKWKGTSVEVYCDRNIQYAGKKVGGIRLREPAPAEVPAEEELVGEPF